MQRVLVSRLAHMVLVLWLLVTLLFVMLHLAPGDAAQHLALDPNVPPEARAALIERLGLDRPLHEQYLVYLGNLAQGDLGVSFSHYPRPVAEILAERLPRTVTLFLTATVLAYALGFALGKVLAWRRGGLLEYGTTIVGVLLYTVFLPWFALLLLWLFAFVLGWFPLRGFLTPSLWRGVEHSANEVFLVMLGSGLLVLAGLVLVRWLAARVDGYRPARYAAVGGILVVGALFAVFWWVSPLRPYAANIAHHSALPIITLTLVTFGGAMLLTRSAMLETLREDYVLAARAKGLPERRVRDRHVARTALLPVVTSLVLSLAFVLSGGVVIETVFAWPGMGQALLEAATQGDVPLALGAITLLGVVALVGHALVDLLASYLDPRIRHP